MKMKQMFSLVVISVIVCGCGTTARLAGQLKNDNSTVVNHLRTIYGTDDFIRTNPRTNQTVTISPDGTVKIESK